MALKKLTHKYLNYETKQILIFGKYVKVRESLHTQVIIWVHNILNHIHTREIFPDIKVYTSEWYRICKTVTYPYHTGAKNVKLQL